MSTNAPQRRRHAPHRSRRPTAASTAIVIFLATIAIAVGGTPAAAATVGARARVRGLRPTVPQPERAGVVWPMVRIGQPRIRRR
jgi:hypothetical protein